MLSDQKPLWQVISEVERMMPISIDGIEKTLGVSLKETSRDENFVYFSGESHASNKNIPISKVDLMVRPSLNFDGKSGLSFEVIENCITLAEIRQHFSGLTLTQAPRGRSLQETTVWSGLRAWGKISFAFKEDNPECLFRVSFRAAMQK